MQQKLKSKNTALLYQCEFLKNHAILGVRCQNHAAHISMFPQSHSLHGSRATPLILIHKSLDLRE